MANKNNQLELMIVERPNPMRYTDGNRYEHKAVIRDINFNVASFHTIEAMSEFIRRFGLHLEFVEAYNSDECSNKEWQAGTIKRYKVRERFHDAECHKTEWGMSPYFWSLSEVPADAEPIKLFCNGSIVDGFTRREGDVINIYRPNPNAKEVYKPLSLAEHIAFSKTKYYF